MVFFANPTQALAPQAITTEYSIINNNSFVATRPISSVTHSKALLSQIGTEDVDSLIQCLIRYESSGNQDAIGDNGRAIGVLQFHKPTFDAYSQRYGLKLDRYNENDQIRLARLMLKENINNLRHWTVYPKCI